MPIFPPPNKIPTNIEKSIKADFKGGLSGDNNSNPYYLLGFGLNEMFRNHERDRIYLLEVPENKLCLEIHYNIDKREVEEIKVI